MSNKLIRRLAILGALSITGIIAIQGLWLKRAYTLEDSEFHQTATIVLYDVATKLAAFNNSELPKQNLIQRQSSNIYAVNVNDAIDANILEDYLIRGFEEKGLNTDFEYAVYDCFSKELVYGNYCKLSDLEQTKASTEVLPTFDDLIYYFVVRFPSRVGFLLSSMWQNIVLGIATVLALTFFIYAMWVILQQKKLSELQKDFINNMTHEFKTPISSIKIAADVISKSEPIKADKRLSRYAEVLIEQNNRLNNQVEKVLSLAQLEEDHFKLNPVSIDLNDLLGQIVDAETMRIRESGRGEIVYEKWNAPVIIRADKLHLSNVIYNLLDNAVKYCQNIPLVKVVLRVTDSKAEIKVLDNGIGIANESIDKLFLKFFRVPTGNVHNVKGFGLGLYYTKNICDAHGWDIRVSSVIDKGSTFTIKIPIP